MSAQSLAQCACGCNAEVRRPGLTYIKGHNGRRPTSERFWEKVDKTEGGCWLWTASQTTAGYGNFRLGDGTWDYAHRLSYSWLVGGIPSGLVLDHLCRVRSCVKPTHLEPVSHSENVSRGMTPFWVLRYTCSRGHDIADLGNVYVAPNGHRRCRVCARIGQNRRRSAA